MKARVAATDAVAQAGGEAIIDDGGSASDAVVCAILAAGAAHAGVLLGPVVALVGGVGAGTRLFDGRTCQPGLGLKRPRGYKPHETIPLAARCAVPRSMAALALVHTYSRKRPLSALVRCAKATIKHFDADDGLEARIGFLEAFPRHGATTLTQLGAAIVHAAGLPAGGLMSERDLAEARPVDTRPDFVVAGDAEVAAPDFEETPRDDAMRDMALGQTRVVVAADGHGQVAAACYLNTAEGLTVPELGMRLAFMATPVMREVPRVTPATPRWTPTPIALLRRPDDGWFAAAGVSGAQKLDGVVDTQAPLTQQVANLRSATDGAQALIASVERGQTGAAAT